MTVVGQTREGRRLEEAATGATPWRLWGPYLSERQWGTVREDYSTNGDAWSYFTHDQARSRAYRWGEDGLAGFCDEKQRLCLALALWNGRDAILKERLFGLTNSEGNHGEDVKECYYYLDSTPTHSYNRFLYKYAQRPYPYAEIVAVNRGRSRTEQEYELLDTGLFDDGRYFDVEVTYAKAGPDDLLAVVTAHNRGPEAAELHLLPTLWFRNTWSWDDDVTHPLLRSAGVGQVIAEHAELGPYRLWCEGDPAILFTENETNAERLFGSPNSSPYVKDAFHDHVVEGHLDAVNPDAHGTKVAAHYRYVVQPGGSATVRLRLASADADVGDPFGRSFADGLAARQQEADEFYGEIGPASATDEERRVVRQAMAGMLWSKQYYAFDLQRWLHEHGVNVRSADSGVRNSEWFHMVTDDVLSMPDTWEYPWFAAWDLAFHAAALVLVDADLAKQQLSLLLDELYQHPSGQLPAYEWNFSDVNPPVHAWATWFVYDQERLARGEGDRDFLRRSFNKLVANFSWWLNRKDPTGRNLFQGGFLGLDNIGVFDRSAPLPTGGFLEQADGTAWMAMYAQDMLRMALELAPDDVVYEDFALRFVEHFLWIASAMDRIGDNADEMWDEKDGFFYDVLRLPDGSAARLQVRSMVGLLPLAAATVIPGEMWRRCPAVVERAQRFLGRHPDVVAEIADPRQGGADDSFLLSVLDEEKLRRVLARMLDEDEFLGPFGIRALSRRHLAEPYTFDVHGEEYRVTYEPAESSSGMFGGNSNWRGPVWLPVNVLLIRGLLNLHRFYGDSFTVECPTGSGRRMDLADVAAEIVRRLTAIFLPDATGRRPVHGAAGIYRTDPHWRDLVLFYEYFHGDNGAGIGASHQTGWTGLIGSLIHYFGDPLMRYVKE